MADFYFTDRKYNQLGIASTDELASSSVIAIDDIGGQEGDYQSVAGGYRSYSATLHFSPDQSAQVKEMAKVGNFVLFKGRAGESVWTTILSSEHDPLAGTNTFVAEDASIDLINGTVGAYAASSAMTIAQYIELFAGDSGFVIGYNEIPDLTRTLKWDSDDSSILTRILSVATQFGVELSFRFEVRGLSVVGKYIDIRKHIGGNKGIYLRVDTDINKIVTTSDIADLCTAIAGTGGTPEGSNDPITLKGYRWTDPNGRYVLGSDGVMRDPVALRTWSRLLSNSNPDPKDAHITRNKTYEATSQATLVQSVLSDLEKFNHPAVNYEVDIAKLPDNVRIGDTVYLVDEDEQLFLSARVLELTYSYSNESGTATLGDYLIQASQVSAEYRALAETLAKQNKGQDGKDGIGIQSSIVTYQAGSSGVSAPTGTWSDAVPNVAANQYLWSRTIITMTDGSTSTTYSVGKMGANGADGIGLKSSAVTYQIGTNGTTAPSGTWSSTIPPASQGTYLWSRTVTLYTDGTQNTSYSVAYQGTNGSKGPQGDQGLPGAKGADGRTAYAHFAYANSQDGKTDFSTTDPNRKYIGFYSDFTSGDSTNPSDYRWSLIKGADGADGKDGVPGKAGADGKTPYFHIAYADSSDGKTNFSLDTPGARKYIGSYTDFTQADSTNPALYSWQLVQGPKGDTGPQGPQGPQGVPGSQNVPMTYVQTAAPTGTIVTNSLWWVGATMSSVTALKRWNGSSWIPESIAQAVLNIIELNAVTINSAIINSPKINVPFSHAVINESGILSSGNLTLNGTSYSIDGSIEDANGKPNGQKYHTELNADGMLSYITQTDGTTKLHTSRISMGVLELSDLISGLGDNATYNTSSLDAEKIYQLNNVSNPLWQGVSLLGWSGDAQSVTPSKKITDCLNGWKLVWGEYSNGTFSGTGIRETEISKTSVLKYPGAGRILSIMNYGNANCSKYVYAYADHIDGNTKNSDGASGGVVLVGVYEY
ncbi:phage tail spike protein [Lacticaseibacillus paracasei]|uniref:phage tail spike protein n=3 Tax=Lacticaseibacillus paracasei TaxID=1597 RepID=UPI00029771B3|nr:phage tail spike protein [Lacticaseibacillus paracasei]EKQ10731.1 phage tail assembly [Lacticaseibacillus paracasei]